jgi:uncharacterized membrane protein YeaQ/YmgE (transglycosylase-associated protein family)
MPELSDLIVWLIVGGITGSVVGAVLAWKKEGFGFWKNLAIGLVGALVGGLIFRIFKIDLGLGQINVSAEQLVASVLGAFLFAVIFWLVRKSRAKKA